MRSRSQILFLIGVIVSGITALAVRATFSSNTVRGELTALDNGYAKSVACDRISVQSEVMFNFMIPLVGFVPPNLVLSSTPAEGSTLKNGCTYALTAQYSPLLQLLPFSSYRISASTPRDGNGEDLGGYTQAAIPPFSEPIDMKF